MSDYDKAYYRAHRSSALAYAADRWRKMGYRQGPYKVREAKTYVCPMPRCKHEGNEQSGVEMGWGKHVVCRTCRIALMDPGVAACLLCRGPLGYGERDLCADCRRYVTLVSGSVWVVTGVSEKTSEYRGRIMSDEMFLSSLDLGYLPPLIVCEHWVQYRYRGSYLVLGEEGKEQWIAEMVGCLIRGDRRELR